MTVSKHHKRSMTPHFLLVHLLYLDRPWLTRLPNNRLQITTAEMGRDLNLAPLVIWPTLFALQDLGLIEGVTRGRVRGIADLTLKPVPSHPEGV